MQHNKKLLAISIFSGAHTRPGCALGNVQEDTGVANTAVCSDVRISSIRKELEQGDRSYYLLIMIQEVLDGLCTAAELSLGVYCRQDSAEDASMQAPAGHKGRRDGPE